MFCIFLCMSNIPFYVQHKSTKYMGHSISYLFILMSNLPFYVQHESTKSLVYSSLSMVILCPTWIYEMHETLNVMHLSLYVQHTVLCPTYCFMSNIDLRNTWDIQYLSFYPYIQHTIVYCISNINLRNL